jgi:integrase
MVARLCCCLCVAVSFVLTMSRGRSNRPLSSIAPDYLQNVVRIITETGLRVYKELAAMNKNQVDLENATVWIPDSKKPNGVAEVPLSPLAFQEQSRIAGPGPNLFPSDKPIRAPDDL